MKTRIKFEHSDIGNGERYAALMGTVLKWVYEDNCWYRWNGSKWEEDISSAHLQAAKKVIDDLKNEKALMTARLKELIVELGFDAAMPRERLNEMLSSNQEYQFLIGELEDTNKSIKKLSSVGKINAMVTMAKSEKDISLSIATFDSKGHYLGVNNGVINLRTGEFIQNDSKYYITKSCSPVFNPDAKCPEWISFMEKMCCGDKDMVMFFQRVFGQALLGTPGKDKLIILHGTGANGKSTMTDTMMSLFSNYAITTTSDAITQSAGNKEYYLADAKGARLMLVNETGKGAYLDEKTVKMLVDSGMVQARMPYGRPFSFQPVATPILTTNYQPRISADYAINRRLIYVDFSYTIPKSDRNPKFRQEVLEPEMSGILNWAIEGCKEYQQYGFEPLPQSIIESTREFIEQNDRVGRFIKEKCVDEMGKRMKLSEFKELYLEWGREHGYKDVGIDRISDDLRNRGYRVEKRTGGRYHVMNLRFRSLVEQETGLHVVLENPPAREDMIDL